MGALLQRLGVELPIVQAGMGGGLAGHELAAAVSAAGGLGTIGILAPGDLLREIAAGRRLSDGPLAVNLLLPFARHAHFEAASDADVLVTFWGRPVRRTSKIWIHQCGSVEEASAARAAGADAVIAQGVEAGGHVRGTMPAMELLVRVRGALPDDYSVLSAGGVTERSDVKTRLDAGAEAVVCGTRFLMAEESGGHPAYKRRLVEARQTVLTELFGVGWPAPHRVVPNQATVRWLGRDSRGPGWLRAFHRATAPLFSRLPVPMQFRLAATQRPSRPLFGPAAATVDGPRTWSRRDRSTQGSASTASATSARRASSSASWPARRGARSSRPRVWVFAGVTLDGGSATWPSSPTDGNDLLLDHRFAPTNGPSPRPRLWRSPSVHQRGRRSRPRGRRPSRAPAGTPRNAPTTRWSARRRERMRPPRQRMEECPEMAESVYRVTEVIGVSSDSWEEAARNAVETAGGTVRDLRIAEVVRQDVTIENGAVTSYRVRLSISFKYETKA